jgi:Fur family ferric uptake transcriptional regulator
MGYEKELKILEDYIQIKNLKHSRRRKQILRIFLQSKRHLTADELYRRAKKPFPKIGYATIYRTLKLFCECEICRELKLEDGITRYEPVYGHNHHDHLICIKCGKFMEVVNPTIEKLQERLSKTKGFVLKKHRLDMYGVCRECREK